MPKLTYQPKIIVSTIVFLGVVLGMVLLVYPMLHGTLDGRLTQIMEQKKTVVELRQERDNIDRAKQDMLDLAGKTVQPESFFSKDTTLVGELSRLEERARKLKVDLNLSVSGTLAQATKAKTASELYMVPVTIRLSGSYSAVVEYIDFLEHFSTIITVRSVSMSANTADSVNANLVASVFLRK
ncbi:MAG: hypothetical protein KBD66_00895 [Candidatus Doudnabacteria bacterium]|nr:hypothetical protein [Candidatus Doudnabacteria bacterium]